MYKATSSPVISGLLAAAGLPGASSSAGALSVAPCMGWLHELISASAGHNSAACWGVSLSSLSICGKADPAAMQVVKPT